MDDVEGLRRYLRTHPPKKWGTPEQFERAMEMLDGHPSMRGLRTRYEMLGDVEQSRRERKERLEALRAEMYEKRETTQNLNLS
mmetsp:Transcript_2157/g.7789  ORF Transcript_2157/g.7789 Transcript_2157/m.7789 type:complete len:83 (-) Transcript_2157:28-276(-)